MMAKIIYAIAPHCMCKWEEKHSPCDRTSSYFELKQHLLLFLNTFLSTKHLRHLSTSFLLFQSNKLSLLKRRQTCWRCRVNTASAFHQPVLLGTQLHPLKIPKKRPTPWTFFQGKFSYQRQICQINSVCFRGGKKRETFFNLGWSFHAGIPCQMPTCSNGLEVCQKQLTYPRFCQTYLVLSSRLFSPTFY